MIHGTAKTPIEDNGAVPVNIQDQVTPPFHRYLMTEEKTDIALTAPILKGVDVIPVSSGHGFIAGHTMLILYGDLFHQSEVVSVSTDNITITSPVPIGLPITGTQIIRGSIEMNINGSVTPVTFYCRPGANASPIDIKHFHVFMIDATEGDDSLYGGLAALTNGSFVVLTNGVDINLGNYKKNQEFKQFGGEPTYTDKAGGGQFSMDFSFNLIEVYGIVLRLEPDKNGLIAFTVNDDLTGLVEHRVVATGQITFNE